MLGAKISALQHFLSAQNDLAHDLQPLFASRAMADIVFVGREHGTPILYAHKVSYVLAPAPLRY